MAMSKKDYVMIAAIVSDAIAGKTLGEVAPVELIANNMADAFKKDNTAFDKKRFMIACGFGG